MFPAIADGAFTTRSPNMSWYCKLDPFCVPKVWVPCFLKMNSSEHRLSLWNVSHADSFPCCSQGITASILSCISRDWCTWSSAALPPPEVLLFSSGFTQVTNFCFLLGFLVLLVHMRSLISFPLLVGVHLRSTTESVSPRITVTAGIAYKFLSAC